MSRLPILYMFRAGNRSEIDRPGPLVGRPLPTHPGGSPGTEFAHAA